MNFWDFNDTIFLTLLVSLILAFIILAGSFKRFKMNIPGYIKWGIPALSLLVITMSVSIVITAVNLLGIIIETPFYEWPFLSAQITRISAHLIVFGAIAGFLLLIPVLKISTLSRFTRILLILFITSVFALSLLLIRWSIVFSLLG